MLIFNKQFRTEEKIISVLIKRIKKSNKIDFSFFKNTEVFKLDNITIYFDVVERELLVKDNADKKILSMDCHYDAYNEMQTARYNWFSELLGVAKDCYGKAIKQKEKLKAASEKLKPASNALQQQKQIAALTAALDKIKGL